MMGRLPFIEQIRDCYPTRKNTVSIIAYHRVKDYDENSYAFDKNLINASCEEFEWQIRYIKKYFTPITFSELKDIVESKSDLPKRSIIITFDDGFDDNYNNAFRILNKYSVPATFFISTTAARTKAILDAPFSVFAAIRKAIITPANTPRTLYNTEISSWE